MRQAVRFILCFLAFFVLPGCDQVTAFVKNMQAPGGFPDGLQNIMSKSVPVTDRKLTYPRLAVALTNTHESREIGAGMADCGHFKVTEWQSESIKQYLEFDACIARTDEQQLYGANGLQPKTYMYNLGSSWAFIEQSSYHRTSDYQPMGVHWTEGPAVAQFFLPPAWINAQQTKPQINLIESFLSFVGVNSDPVDPRVWFYQIDQST